MEFLAQYTDKNSKKNQLWVGEAKLTISPIELTHMDYVVHDLNVICLNEFAFYVET